MRYITLAALLFLLHATPAFAATLGVTAQNSVRVGDILSARIVVNSGGVAINNAETTLLFPTNMLRVVSVSKTGSIFNLWVEEPAFSNAAGTITLNGGVPNPGYTGAAGTVVTITYEALQPGTATLILSNSAVRANDGLGTNVLTNATGADITIAAQVTPTTPTPATPTPAAPAPTQEGALLLSSPTHPVQTKWYGASDVRIAWQLSKGATSVQTGMTRESDDLPRVTYTPGITEKLIEDLDDGIWYFRARYRLNGTWSPIATYKVAIDTAEPTFSEFDATYSAADGGLIVRGKADDSRSGISEYQIQINDDEPIIVSATEFHSGGVDIPFDEPGSHRVTLTALDQAGNPAVTSTTVVVPQGIENQTFLRLGGVGITLFQAFAAMFVIAVLSLILAAAALIRLYMYRSAERLPVRRVRKDLHRAFDLYSQELVKGLKSLDDEHKHRKLSRDEQGLYRRMADNLTDLEKYLNKELDSLE